MRFRERKKITENHSPNYTWKRKFYVEAEREEAEPTDSSSETTDKRNKGSPQITVRMIR